MALQLLVCNEDASNAKVNEYVLVYLMVCFGNHARFSPQMYCIAVKVATRDRHPRCGT